MTPDIMAWAESIVMRHQLAVRSVLEIGSHNYNGSVRQLFTGNYLGIDLQDGPGVDLVTHVDGVLSVFDVVVMTEVMEHDLCFWETWAQISQRLLTPGGHLLVTTCNIAFPRHDYPSDYYRFTMDALHDLAANFGMIPVATHETPETVMLLAKRVG